MVVKKTGASAVTKVYTSITYDHMYRVSSISQKYNTGAMHQVAAYTYNEIGQVISKGLGQVASGTIPADLSFSTTISGTKIASHSITLSHGATIPSGSTFTAFISTGYLQTVDYRYNIRGQLLSMNNSKLSSDGGVTNSDYTDMFGMQFLYNDADADLGDTARYNGRLAAVKWMSMDATGTKSYERAYSYGYDALGRLTSANYAERTAASTGAFSNNVGGFDESGIKYDENGNILALNRNSSTQGTNTHIQVDNLAYTYDGTNPNQLQKVSDGTGANYTGYGFRNLTGAASTAKYTYDVNGNLKADPYKGLALNYNILNRTDNIVVTGSGTVYYTYTADGALLRKRVYNNAGTPVLQSTTDYVDGFVYTTAGAGTAALSYFAAPEGRVRNNGGTLKNEYVITDQQGNARVSIEESATSPGIAVLRQENSYYAFGLVMANSPVSTPTTDNKQLYNGGSEWQNDFGNLPDYYETFYRNYDAALGRFVGVDPMPESAESMSSYNYAGNNPVMFNDPLGNFMADPTQPGFNQQVGDMWTSQAGFNSSTYNGSNSVNDAAVNGPTALYGGGANAAYYALLNAAITGDAEAVQQFAAMNGLTISRNSPTATTSSSANPRDALTYLRNYVNAGNDINDLTVTDGKIYYQYQTSWVIRFGDEGKDFDGGIVNHSGYLAANQGDGSQAAFVGGALLSSGWAADGLDPEPITKVVGAAVMIGVSAKILYDNRTYLANSAVSLYNKMTAEIDRIATKAAGPQGFQYELLAARSGLYPNVRGGTTFLNAGDVWKYGETTSNNRYSQGYLNSMGLIMNPQFYGNQMEIKIQEKVMIYGYFMQNGSLPAGNSIFR